ncbi:acyl carrier protein [Nocardiopsis nanhaiensis]
MSKQITVADLTRILVECAGETEGIDPGSDIGDIEFEALGYDSLALMETAARIKDEYGVDISDDVVAELRTPRSFVDTVNNGVSEGV